MMPYTTYTEIFELWPDRVTLARDIGVAPARARKWHNRDILPPAFWNRLVRAAIARDYMDVSLFLLATIAEQKGEKS